MQKSAWLKWFVPQLYHLLRGVLEWQALKYFYMIHRVGRPQPFWLIRFCEATQTSECQTQVKWSCISCLAKRQTFLCHVGRAESFQKFSVAAESTPRCKAVANGHAQEERDQRLFLVTSQRTTPRCVTHWSVLNAVDIHTDAGRATHRDTYEHTHTHEPVHANHDLMRCQDEDEDYLAIPIEELASR